MLRIDDFPSNLWFVLVSLVSAFSNFCFSIIRLLSSLLLLYCFHNNITYLCHWSQHRFSVFIDGVLESVAQTTLGSWAPMARSCSIEIELPSLKNLFVTQIHTHLPWTETPLIRETLQREGNGSYDLVYSRIVEREWGLGVQWLN